MASVASKFNIIQVGLTFIVKNEKYNSIKEKEKEKSNVIHKIDEDSEIINKME
jgi:hypothetical protein